MIPAAPSSKSSTLMRCHFPLFSPRILYLSILVFFLLESLSPAVPAPTILLLSVILPLLSCRAPFCRLSHSYFSEGSGFLRSPEQGDTAASDQRWALNPRGAEPSPRGRKVTEGVCYSRVGPHRPGSIGSGNSVFYQIAPYTQSTKPDRDGQPGGFVRYCLYWLMLFIRILRTGLSCRPCCTGRCHLSFHVEVFYQFLKGTNFFFQRQPLAWKEPQIIHLQLLVMSTATFNRSSW